MTISKYDVSYGQIFVQIIFVIIMSVYVVNRALNYWDMGLVYVLFHKNARVDMTVFLGLFSILVFLYEICNRFLKIKRTQKKYKNYFKEEKYIAIKELSKEVNTELNTVIKELELLVGDISKRDDIKKQSHIQFSSQHPVV